MKVATFTRAMAPYVAGESRVVPDDVAARLEQDGDATLSPFPPTDVAPARPAKRYKTKDRR
jgi:hypothetical protein